MTAKAVVFFGAGALLLIAAVVVALNTRAFLRGSIVAPGVVEYLNAGGSHPQVAFTTARGERISYPQGGMVSGWRQGDRVMVRYLADRPRSAVMDRFLAIWTPALFLGAMGVAMLLAGLATWKWG
ncbi:DUF3592 domain-containing protein [Sphingomonas sp.]|uniref:DUF3592 domain-containing protein n=1 Tax=Sphingomonas sp. TaxID=28214 RepID=UPI003CC67BAF